MNYPSNSARRVSARKDVPEEPAEPKKLERVVEGEVVYRKKSVTTRFKQAFLGGGDRSILEFVIQDVFIPGVKDMLFEGQQRAAEQFFYGESSVSRRVRSGDPRRGPINYNARASRSRAPEPQVISSRARARHDFGEVIIGSRPEAEAVLEQMFAALDTYDAVTVSDLYELLGQSSQFTDRNWGWTDLRGSDIRPIREGYLLILPPTESLSR